MNQLETALNTAPAITDPQELKTLGDRLTAQIREKWKTQSAVTEALAYRVGVARNGDVIGFKAETPAALNNARQTPLLDLLYLPANGSTPASEPLAQYRVLFKPQGNFEVTPVTSPTSAVSPSSSAAANPAASPVTSAAIVPSPDASPSVAASPAPSPSVAASPTAPVTGAELTDAATLENLQPKLYDALDQNWKGRPPFNKDLVFRVRIKPDGTIAGFQPDNLPATEFAKDTPLPQMGKPIDPNAPAEPAASFKVVFKPSGVLQVNPWYGARQ